MHWDAAIADEMGDWKGPKLKDASCLHMPEER